MGSTLNIDDDGIPDSQGGQRTLELARAHDRVTIDRHEIVTRAETSGARCTFIAMV